MPVDEREMDRMDMQHQKYYLLLNDRHYLAPILNPQRILDLGTGTGTGGPLSSPSLLPHNNLDPLTHPSS